MEFEPTTFCMASPLTKVRPRSVSLSQAETVRLERTQNCQFGDTFRDTFRQSAYLFTRATPSSLSLALRSLKPSRLRLTFSWLSQAAQHGEPSDLYVFC